MKSFFKYFILIIIVVGLFSFAYNIWERQTYFIKNSSESTGEVIGISKNKGSDNIMYAPIVEYEYKNTVKTFISRFYSNPPQYKVGDKVNILIPGDNSNPEVNSFMSLWFGFMVLTGMGVVFLLILILNIVFAKKRRQIDKLLDTRGTIIKATNPKVIESTYWKKRNGETETLSNKIKAQWINPQNGKVYVFESEDIDYDPTPYIKDTIDIRVLLDNPKIYRFENLPEAEDMIN